MSNISQFIRNPWAQPTLGADVSRQNLLEMGPDGLAYPCVSSNYASVSQMGTVILANTTPSGTGLSAPQANGGQIVVVGDNGYIFVLSAIDSGPVGVSVDKYTPDGVLVDHLQALSGSGMTTANIAILSNGNLLITAAFTISTVEARFIVVTQTFEIVQSGAFNNGTSAFTTAVSSCALSGGGFAAAYRTGTTTIQLSVYNNLGVLTSSAAAITADTYTSYGIVVKELSNGEILLGYSVSSLYKFARYNTSAVIQGSLTSTGSIFNAAGTGATSVNVSVLPGFFAIGFSGVSAGTYLAQVWSNANAQQGSTITANISFSPDNVGYNFIVNDGVDFWISSAGNVAWPYTKVTTAGVATLYYPNVSLGNLGRSSAYYAGMGNIVTTSADGSVAQYMVFNIPLLRQIVPPTTFATANFPNVIGPIQPIPLGDGAVLFYSTPGAENYINITKVYETAIIGPAAATATQGNVVAADNTRGTKTITRLRGDVSTPFTSLINGGGSINGTLITQNGAGFTRSID